MDKILGVVSLGAIAILWAKIRAFFEKYSKVIQPVCEEIERRARDGIISLEDRKAIAMLTVEKIVEAKGGKLNVITKFLISLAINVIAKRLPAGNINVKDTVAKIEKEF